MLLLLLGHVVCVGKGIVKERRGENEREWEKKKEKRVFFFFSYYCSLYKK